MLGLAVPISSSHWPRIDLAVFAALVGDGAVEAVVDQVARLVGPERLLVIVAIRCLGEELDRLRHERTVVVVVCGATSSPSSSSSSSFGCNLEVPSKLARAADGHKAVVVVGIDTQALLPQALPIFLGPPGRSWRTAGLLRANVVHSNGP